MTGLTVRQMRFVDIVARDEELSATKAAISAGYAEKSAHISGPDNLRNPTVLEAIRQRKDQLAAAAGITREFVLSQWFAIASADPRELVNVTKFRCESCWEMEDAELPPNPECKRCKGVGVALVNVADTRSLSPAAQRLYAGAKQTKDGVEIKMRDQDAALRNIADYLGMLNKSKGELTGAGGGPLQIQPVRAEDLTDDQLAAYLAQAAQATMGVDAGVSVPALPAGVTIEGT